MAYYLGKLRRKIFGRSKKQDIIALETNFYLNPNPNQKQLKLLTKIMKGHKHSINISLCTTHYVSTYALDETNAIYLTSRRLLPLLTYMIRYHIDHPKLVWKLCSCIWNISRPEVNADEIPYELPALLLDALCINRNSARTVHTILGALSNLALSVPHHFQECINARSLLDVLDVVKQNNHNDHVVSLFGSFVANLAVEELHAMMCVDLGYIEQLVHNLYTNDDLVLIKHSIAGLHNLSDCNEFIRPFISSYGPERIITMKNQLLNDHEHDHDEIISYIDGIYELANIPENCTTALQVASVFCADDIVVDILAEDENINQKTLDNLSCIQLAIKHKNFSGAQTLATLGINCENIDAEIHQLPKIRHQIRMSKRIKKGISINKEFRAIAYEFMRDQRPKMHGDIIRCIIEYISGVELLYICDHIENPEVYAMAADGKFIENTISVYDNYF